MSSGLTSHQNSSNLLRFQNGSAKLPKRIIHFSLPSGHTCGKCAVSCLTLADRKSGKISRGKDAQFNCYAAMAEAVYPSVRRSRWNNYLLVKGKSLKDTKRIILDSLEGHLWTFWSDYHVHPIIRIHVGGEFFSQCYFDSWLSVAKDLPFLKFYAFTKAIDFWEKRLANIPKNLNLTASFGGKWDSLIWELGLKYNKVVFSEDEALKLGLPIDKDDWYAHTGKIPFASLLHGVQPKDTKAAAALSALKKKGFKGYGKDSYKRPNPSILSEIDKHNIRSTLPRIQKLLDAENT